MFRYRLLSFFMLLLLGTATNYVQAAGMALQPNPEGVSVLTVTETAQRLTKEQKRVQRKLDRLQKKLAKWERTEKTENAGLAAGAVLGILGLVLLILGLIGIGFLLLVIGIVLLALGLVFGLLGAIF